MHTHVPKVGRYTRTRPLTNSQTRVLKDTHAHKRTRSCFYFPLLAGMGNGKTVGNKGKERSLGLNWKRERIKKPKKTQENKESKDNAISRIDKSWLIALSETIAVYSLFLIGDDDDTLGGGGID